MNLKHHYCEPENRTAVCGFYPSSALYYSTIRGLTTCKDCLAWITRVEREEIRQAVNDALKRFSEVSR